MLNFARVKTVGVQAQGDDRWVAHGRLDDALYTIDLEIYVDRPTWKVSGAKADLVRYTTFRCPLAEPFVDKALGRALGPELDRLLKDEIGKPGCRHLANLFRDCAQGVARAELAAFFETARTADPAAEPAAVFRLFGEKFPELATYVEPH